MKVSQMVVAALALSTPVVTATAQTATLPAPAPLSALTERVQIPYERFRLPNGLTVIVHTDRKAPLVHVGVWYDVGSVDEPVGRSGFAHLFEHLMFYGTAHHRDDHFKPLEAIGATDFNGTTSFDRTNYFQTVPTPALDMALFLESDRMGHMLPALTPEKLEAQRKVVQNEKRQGDNQPGGLLRYAMLQSLFPVDHPMHLSTIGREEDIQAATLADAHDWFRSHYGPNNAVLVLAGDIDAKTAKKLAEKYFGQIPSGPTPGRFKAPLPQRTETTRETLYDKVAAPRLSRIWIAPPLTAPDLADLQIAMIILGSGQTSRLYETLVRKERLAVSVGASASPQSLAGLASVDATAAPDVDLEKLDQRIDALLAEFLEKGPTQDEVDRVAMRIAASTIRGLEKIGGFGGKGATLAEGQLYHGDPAAYQKELARFAAATPESVRDAARKWLSRGDHRLRILPGERNPKEIHPAAGVRHVEVAEKPAIKSRAVGKPVDRSKGLPAAGPATDFTLPAIQQATLSNGIKLVFVRNTVVPVVRMVLSMPLGVASDDRQKPGTQNLMLALLDEGTQGELGPMSGPEIARLTERLGLSIGASANVDRTFFRLNAITPNLAPSVRLFADVVRHPTFPVEQLERLRVQALTGLRQEATNPQSMAMRALPALIYGKDHPYGLSFSGSGTEEGLKAITQADLIRFHQQGVRPEGATLFVVGDTQLDELLPLLEKTFGDWKGHESVPTRVDTELKAAPQAAGKIVLIDRPDSPQSMILAAAPLPITGKDDTLPISLANDVFGGLASARLNTELREKRNWSYGAYSGVSSTQRQMPFTLSASVETNATADSIREMRRLITEFHTSAPPTEAEIARARANSIRGIPGDFETGNALLSALERNRALGRPDDYLATLAARLEAVSNDSIAKAPLPKADDLVWIVVGDAKVIGPKLKELGLPIEER